MEPIEPQNPINTPPPPPPSSAPGGVFPPMPPRRQPPSSRKTLGIILLVLSAYYFIFVLPNQIIAYRAHKRQAEEERQRKAQEAAKPHQEVLALINDLKAHGTALPPCPLIYPLLDGKGKMTYLGSYLSYFSMKQGSYLPRTVFRIPNAGEIYNEFGLFDPDSPMHQAYRTQLPLYFGTKDLGEGKLLKSGSSYLIKVRFWGTHPEKEYFKNFPKGKLHLAIGWLAACMQDYVGFQPTAEQAAYMAKPIFTNDGDLNRAARLESFFRNGGAALITNWDKILAKNPENPYLLDRWAAVLNSRDQVPRFGLIEPLVQKYPDATFYKLDYIYELYLAERYDDGFKGAMQEMMRDDNDPDWYQFAADCLWSKKYYEETIQLLRTWTELHPDNTDAWIALEERYIDWAWVARGDGWADTVTKEGWRLMKERMALAVKACDQAAVVAPEDCRVWSKHLGLGNGAEFSKEKMEGYFKKVLELNPYRYRAYDAYLEYLTPKWFGSKEELLSFSKKYSKYYPFLLSSAIEDLFQTVPEDDSEEGRKAWFKKLREKMNASPYLKDFEESYFAQLRLNPWNLDVWNNFLYWEDLAGRQEIVLNFAKKLAKKNPELKALGPNLFLLYVKVAEKNLVTDDDRWNFEERRSVANQTEKAYQDLLKSEPNNWRYWNRLAFYSVNHHDYPTAKKAFRAIGDHWAPDVWPRDIFDRYAALSQKCPACEGTGVASCGAPGCYHGAIRCPNHCLQLFEGEWIHLHVQGHPDTDIWRQFWNEDGSYLAASQHHIGDLFRYENGQWVDKGLCPLCHGKGWIECPTCHGKKVCATCHGTGNAKKEKHKAS